MIQAVKVTSFYDFESLKMALDTFGSNLKRLEAKNCYCFNMAYLASVCTKLERLSLLYWGIADSDDDTAATCWTPQTFLPLLTHFKMVNGCLGVWAPLIEKKSTLVSLSLECCHIGTNVNNLVPIFFIIKYYGFHCIFFLSIDLQPSPGMEAHLRSLVFYFGAIGDWSVLRTYDGHLSIRPHS